MSTAARACIEKLAQALRTNTDNSLSVATLEELYTRKHGNGVWEQPPKRALLAFLEGHPDVFYVENELVILSPKYDEWICMERLEEIVKEAGVNESLPMRLALLRHVYHLKFGTECWKPQPQHMTFVSFLAPFSVFRIIGEDHVDLNQADLEMRCVSRLQRLLRASVGGAALDITNLEAWYEQDFGPGCWNESVPKQTLPEFLVQRPGTFHVSMKAMSKGKVFLAITMTQCIENLRQIIALTGGGSVAITELGNYYKRRFGALHWSMLGKKLTDLLNEHPDIFYVNAALVSLANTAVTKNTAGSGNPAELPKLETKASEKLPIFGNHIVKEEKQSETSSLTSNTIQPNPTTTVSLGAPNSSRLNHAPSLPVTVTSSILPTSAELIASLITSPATPRQFDVPVLESEVLRPASPAVSIVDFRISDLSMPTATPTATPIATPTATSPRFDDNVGKWRSAIASESFDGDDGGAMSLHELQPRHDQNHTTVSTVAVNLSESLASSGSHRIWGSMHADEDQVTRNSSSQEPMNLDALEVGPSARLQRRRSDFRDRVRQLDPGHQVAVLERLVEAERRRNRQRVTELRRQVVELRRLIRERDVVIDLQQARIDELEEMLTLEGELQGLDMDGFEM